MSSGALANFQQKMNSLRLEADENATKAEELKAKVKVLEQENLQKEQEITSLTHRNQLLEAEVEKLEKGLKDAQKAAVEGSEHGEKNENLTRRLQLLEEEAEAADKTLRETNDKCIFLTASNFFNTNSPPGSDRQMSRQATTSAKYKHWSNLGTSGRPNTRRWRRSMRNSRKSFRSWRSPWEIFDWQVMTSEAGMVS
jgi:Tropomyosin like